MKSQIELKENYLPQSCRLWSVVCCCRHFLIPTLYPHLYLNLLAFHKHALNLDRAHAVIFICNAVWHLRSQKGKLLRRLIYSLLRERVHSHTRCICCLGVTPFFFWQHWWIIYLMGANFSSGFGARGSICSSRTAYVDPYLAFTRRPFFTLTSGSGRRSSNAVQPCSQVVWHRLYQILYIFTTCYMDWYVSRWCLEEGVPILVVIKG